MREYADREGFVIVTKDSDFSDLCILLAKSHLDTSWELQQ
jgi:predicted nuclease of predicted toxin-antitoxin system